MKDNTNKEAMQALGAFIKNARNAAGFSQQYIAIMANVSIRTLSSIENGTANPTCNTVFEILKACRCYKPIPRVW